MAKVKYGPVEIDGVNILEATERLLQADDVDLDLTEYVSDNVSDGFLEVDDRINAISGVDFDKILTAYFSDVLIDFNGNVLEQGY